MLQCCYRCCRLRPRGVGERPGTAYFCFLLVLLREAGNVWHFAVVQAIKQQCIIDVMFVLHTHVHPSLV